VSEDRDGPGIGAEDEERVRRALADAADPGPVPADVADRLDAVLAGLVRERAGQSPRSAEVSAEGGPAPSPATRRRWPGLLAAAVVASLVALGVGTLVRAGSGSVEQSTGSAASAPDRQATSAAPEGAGGHGTLGPAGPAWRLRSATFAQDAQRLADSRRSTLADTPAQGLRAAAPAPPGCLVPARPPGGRVLHVTFDGRPATLVLGPVRHGAREARAYSCADAGRPLAAAQVRAR
jgi:hypothetical protein